MRKILALSLLLTFSSTTIAGEERCLNGDLCKALDAAGKRHTQRTGGPDRRAVCFHVLMKDPQTAIIMTIRYHDGHEYRHSYPRGSAAHAAGSARRLPLFCIEENKLRGAVAARICTDTKGGGGSTNLSPRDIAYWLTVRHVPESQPACLLGVAACAAINIRH